MMNNLSNYLDFLIEVGAVMEQTYSIVVRSDAGETRQLTTFPFTPEALATYLRILGNAVLPALEDLHKVPGSNEAAMQTFGRALFDFLLPGEIRTLYYECLREATHHNRGVRIKLSVRAHALAALPWEFLYDARRRDFVCLDPYTSLVRYTELPQTTPALTIEPPLQILGVIADPLDLPSRLDVQAEKHQISNAVRSLEERGLVQLTWLEGQTWRDLQRIMRTADTPWHIFHFIGHGGFDEAHNEGFILLADEEGQSHQLYASQLARLLARQRASLRLVLLNACEGARTGSQNLFSSIAATLINSGVPAVLAMQYEIADTAAVEFANTFYESLADNLPVDAAVAEARNAINFRNAHSMEWGIPVLYMRAPDGHLFALTNANYAAASHRSYVRMRAKETAALALAASPAILPPEVLTAPPADLLDMVLTAVQQQGTHFELYADSTEADTVEADTVEDGAESLAHPAAEIGATSEDVSIVDALPKPTVEQSSAPIVQYRAPAPPTADPLDITDLLYTYAHRHHSMIGFEWVTIPAGIFWMGSDPDHDRHAFEDELPQFRPYLPTFEIARIPVTNVQYKLFVDATAYPAPPHWIKDEIPLGKENHPVVNVSWRAATAFCEWAGVRLPTEAEWEKAARGSDGRIYPWGDTPPEQTRCNFDYTVGTTVAVGSYPDGVSPYGVWDMAGNVWEWTASIWLDSYEQYSDQLRIASPNNLRRVLRGGGFRDVEFVRCTARSWDLVTQRYRDVGFRVVAMD